MPPAAQTRPTRDPVAFTEAVRAQDWRRLHTQLARFAFYRCKRTEMAQDLAQEAIRRVVDPATSTWDPVATPDPAPLLMSLLNGLLRNDTTSARTRRDLPMTETSRTGDEANDEVERKRVLPDPKAFSEAAFLTADLFTRRVALLRSRLADHPDALRVLDWMTDGHDTPADLRAVSDWPLDRVLAARKKVHRYAADVARDLDADPDREDPDDDDVADHTVAPHDDDDNEEVA